MHALSAAPTGLLYPGSLLLLEFLLLAELCICPGTFPSSTYLLASWGVTAVSWGLLPSQQ